MKNIVRIVTAALVLSIILATLAPAFAAGGYRTVTFNVGLRKNVIWAKYGVDIYIDGQKTIHLDQGDSGSFKATLTDGQHKLEIRGAGYSYTGVSKAWYMSNLSSGDAVDLGIQTHESWIELLDTKINGVTVKVDTTNHDYWKWAGKLVSWILCL